MSLLSGVASADTPPPRTYAERYDAFHISEKKVAGIGLPSAVVARAIADEFERQFPPSLHPSDLRSLTSKELDTLFDAVYVVSFYTMNAGYEAELMRISKELQNRGVGTLRQRQLTYDALITSRLWAEASSWASQFPELQKDDIQSLPVNAHAVAEITKFLLYVNPESHKAIVQEAHIDDSISIIAITHPLCHFSNNAIASIRSMPIIFDAMKKSTLWLTPQKRGLDLGPIGDWNKKNPDIQFKTAYRAVDFPEIDNWDTPVFYFYKQGKLTEKIVGWPAEGNILALTKALQNLGLLNSK